MPRSGGACSVRPSAASCRLRPVRHSAPILVVGDLRHPPNPLICGRGRPRPNMDLPTFAASVSRGDVWHSPRPPKQRPRNSALARSGGACSVRPSDVSRRLMPVPHSTTILIVRGLRLPPNPCYAAGGGADLTGRPSHLRRPYLGAIGGIRRALRNNAHVTVRH